MMRLIGGAYNLVKRRHVGGTDLAFPPRAESIVGRYPTLEAAMLATTPARSRKWWHDTVRREWISGTDDQWVVRADETEA